MSNSFLKDLNSCNTSADSVSMSWHCLQISWPYARACTFFLIISSALAALTFTPLLRHWSQRSMHVESSELLEIFWLSKISSLDAYFSTLLISSFFFCFNGPSIPCLLFTVFEGQTVSFLIIFLPFTCSCHIILLLCFPQVMLPVVLT